MSPTTTFLSSMRNAVKRLRAAGVAIDFDGSTLRLTEIPSWRAFRYAWDRRQALCALAIVRHVMRQPMEPLEVRRNCTFCRKYKQYTCDFHATNEHGIPAATFARGCEHFDANLGLYF